MAEVCPWCESILHVCKDEPCPFAKFNRRSVGYYLSRLADEEYLETLVASGEQTSGKVLELLTDNRRIRAQLAAAERVIEAADELRLQWPELPASEVYDTERAAYEKAKGNGGQGVME